MDGTHRYLNINENELINNKCVDISLSNSLSIMFYIEDEFYN